jgi:hypothetical protein
MTLAARRGINPRLQKGGDLSFAVEQSGTGRDITPESV